MTEHSDHVVLLHGLWMRGFALSALRRKLEAAGFTVSIFDYRSVTQDFSATIARLHTFTRNLADRRVHFVGHSLGGLLALRVLQEAPDLIDGRVVCLGSPLRGSAIARTLSAFRGGTFLLGRNHPVLTTGISHWSGPHALGVISGNLPIGLGIAMRKLARPHDGTVSVEETMIPGLTAHRVIAVSHTGLLFSPTAAILVAEFLRNGHFPPEASG